MKTSLTCYFFVFLSLSLYAKHIPITIWIHGTNVQTLLPIQPRRYVQWHTAPPGLHNLSDITPEYNVHSLLTTLTTTRPDQFPAEHTYAFGWSGVLDGDHRKHAAKQLAHELNALVKLYLGQKHTVDLTIICHSHGGNIALQLAHFSVLCPVEKLVLLGCPVQEDTAHLTKQSMFRKIYSFYSRGDFVQIGDPQALHIWRKAIVQAIRQSTLDPLKVAWQNSKNKSFFSARLFEPHPALKNIQVSWLNSFPWTAHDIQSQPGMVSSIMSFTSRFLQQPHPVLHTEFILPSFAAQIPSLIARADTEWNKTKSAHLSLAI